MQFHKWWLSYKGDHHKLTNASQELNCSQCTKKIESWSWDGSTNRLCLVCHPPPKPAQAWLASQKEKAFTASVVISPVEAAKAQKTDEQVEAKVSTEQEQEQNAVTASADISHVEAANAQQSVVEVEDEAMADGG